MDTILLFSKFGTAPKLEDRDEILNLLITEIENEDHECMRVLCFMLFYIGVVEDCEIIWRAKMLNMDAGCMIDGNFLCGAGYDETLCYLDKKAILPRLRNYLQPPFDKNFDKKKVVDDALSYYRVTPSK
jgi:hypothetical protein